MVQALATLGFEAETLHEPIFVRDYRGNATKEKVNVVLKREKMGGDCSDIGWLLENGEAECHADPYCNARISALGGLKRFFEKVQQEYAVEVVRKQARARGQTVHRVNEQDGRVRLLVPC